VGLIGAVTALSTSPLPVAEALGNWPAPFGIILIADPLVVLMLALVAGLASVVLLQVIVRGVDREGPSFHPLLQFLLMGLNGAFLTGDAFTLFVCFEVLLIASYGLAVHGGGAARLKAGMRYVITNLVGSTLFLIGLGVIYAVTGTLNMADLSVKIAALPPGDHALIRVAAVMLLMVFALKAALVPLHVWLPGTYANAPAVVAAFFAVMTKVGAYATLRFGTLVFPTATFGPLLSDLLLPAALVTLIIGAFGMLAGGPLNRIAAYAAIASTGTLFIALSAFTPEGTIAALYYLIHSTLAVAALFLIADVIPAKTAPNSGPLAALYFATAIAIAGMPPLSGFLGKLLILQAQWHNAALVWPTVLIASLLTIIALARAGSDLFWKQQTAAAPLPLTTLAAPALLLTALTALTVFAGPATAALTQIAASLFDPAPYLAAQGLTP
ncbi:MAG: proton-conducting transporter membrane subunit, partial [Paracoccaceae bacterium]